MYALDRESAYALSQTVEEACGLLSQYNSRLQVELQERKHVAKMLRDFVAAQKTAQVEAEEKLQVNHMISHRKQR